MVSVSSYSSCPDDDLVDSYNLYLSCPIQLLTKLLNFYIVLLKMRIILLFIAPYLLSI